MKFRRSDTNVLGDSSGRESVSSTDSNQGIEMGVYGGYISVSSGGTSGEDYQLKPILKDTLNPSGSFDKLAELSNSPKITQRVADEGEDEGERSRRKDSVFIIKKDHKK